MKRPRESSHLGLTLIELLAVLAIIAIIAALMYPLYSLAIKQAWNLYKQQSGK